MATKGTSCLDTKEALTYIPVKGESCSTWGGYKKELITQKLTLLEENLIVCSRCTGVMRDACSIKGGLAQVCEGCLGKENEFQPGGPIRTTVAKLSSKCPLKGCDWEGTLGDMDCHLDECNQFIVSCPFVKYGCKKELKRGELESHRKEAKEYHTEVVCVFMADKVEKLEEEKREQTKIIENLQFALAEVIQLKDYLKFNGVNWIIGNRHVLINKIYELQGKPQTAVAGITTKDTVAYKGDAAYSYWGGDYMDGPRFLIHSYYYFYPRLYIQANPNAIIQIVSNYLGYSDKKLIWPLHGKCTIILMNHNDGEDNWMHEMDNFEISNGDTLNITDITFDVLLDEKYKRDNTLVMKILIKPNP